METVSDGIRWQIDVHIPGTRTRIEPLQDTGGVLIEWQGDLAWKVSVYLVD
jgi:hypothetical protein